MFDHLKSAKKDNERLIKIQQNEIKKAIKTMKNILNDILSTSLKEPEKLIDKGWKQKRVIFRGAIKEMYFRLKSLTIEGKRKLNIKKGKWL